MRTAQSVRLVALLCVASLFVAHRPGLSSQGMEETKSVKSLGDSKFTQIPGSPDCFQTALENGQPEKEASIMLMKASAGCTVPWHWHISSEQIMMVRGTARTGVRGAKPVVLQSGGFLLVPPHHVMQFACVSACTLFVYTGGPFEIHYVNEKGDEIPPDEALKVTKEKSRRPKPR